MPRVSREPRGSAAAKRDLARMRLGFLGTGTITSAIVAGMRREPPADGPIVLSPRNAQVAARLASTYARVSVAATNQAMIDSSDVVFLAVRPQIAQAVLSTVDFRSDQRVISLIATYSRDRIALLVRPARTVCCAVPLPMVAEHLGPTAIYPPDPIAAQLFSRLGLAVEVTNESELKALWASSAVMASYFALQDAIGSWLDRHGVARAMARDYVTMLFDGLGRVPRRSDTALADLVEAFKTKGGLNEQCAEQLRQAGVFDACALALDAILARIEGGNDVAQPKTPAQDGSGTAGEG